VNAENPFESYLNSVSIQSGSNNTLKAYQAGLKHFSKFLEKQNHEIPNLFSKLKDGLNLVYNIICWSLFVLQRVAVANKITL